MKQKMDKFNTTMRIIYKVLFALILYQVMLTCAHVKGLTGRIKKTYRNYESFEIPEKGPITGQMRGRRGY